MNPRVSPRKSGRQGGGSEDDSSHDLAETVLVTGATGFLGTRLAKQLLKKGVFVRGTGRNLSVGLELAKAGVQFRPVDICDRAAVIRSCEGMGSVVHCAALSSPWGKESAFFQTNVEGTRNVIEGCLEHGVKKLVYISSPSVVSRHQNQHDLTEENPPPKEFVSFYSKSKWLGEELVRQADGIEHVVLRPKAIYGAGDKTLLPRMLRLSRSGRLPLFGDTPTVTHLTHVSDVVDAIILALKTSRANQKTYFIAGPRISIEETLSRLFDMLGQTLATKRWSVTKAMFVARVLEIAWRSLLLPGEPPLTRYVASILSYDQTYDTSLATTELGFVPRVSLEEGFREVIAEHGAQHRSQQISRQPIIQRAESGSDYGPIDDLRPLPCRVFNSGSVRVAEPLFLPEGKLRMIDVPALFSVIEHPDQGVVLFDTGYTPRFYDGTRDWPYRLYRHITPAVVSRHDTAVEQLRGRGIDADDVRLIILSHFDPDHYGGIADFPKARVMCSWRAWSSVAGKKGWAALRQHLLPCHLPDDFPSRLELLPDFEGAQAGGLGPTMDVFGDNSIRLVQLPGHAPGHLGALVRNTRDELFFLVADAIWSIKSLHGCCSSGLHHWIAHDRVRRIR
ncbi:MAG: NAD-dependent epimerase/dehydratase family protein, partial [Gammaproteobacteria bacterium]